MNKNLPMPPIVIDTREPDPHPWAAVFPQDVQIVRQKLDTGDLSLHNYTDLVAIERKSLDDLVQCLSRERDRFERELSRSRSLHRFAVVCEAPLLSVIHGRYRSAMAPNAVLASVCAQYAKWGVPVLFADTVAGAGRLALELLYQWFAYHIKIASRYKGKLK